MGNLYNLDKSKVLMEETLDIALDSRCSNNSIEFFKIRISFTPFLE